MMVHITLARGRVVPVEWIPIWLAPDQSSSESPPVARSTKGRGFWFHAFKYASMACTRFGTLTNTPRRTAFCVISLKHGVILRVVLGNSYSPRLLRERASDVLESVAQVVDPKRVEYEIDSSL